MSRSMCRTILMMALTAAPPSSLFAQGPPGTEIYLAPLSADGGRLVVGTPINTTNRAGYDNQPSFTPDGSAFYYTSYRDGQSDVYRYVIATRQTARVTATAESEYSPTVMPGGSRFSVVRVEADSTQRLWSFALDGSDPQLVIPTVAPVGYHAWLSVDVVALFVLGTPNTLQIFHALAGTPMTVTDDIGRTLARVPGSADLSFIKRGANGENWIMRYGGDGEFRQLAETPATEFFAWLPDGSALLTGGDSRLYWWQPGRHETWVEITDLSSHGIAGITRLAVGPNGRWLVFVAAEASE